MPEQLDNGKKLSLNLSLLSRGIYFIFITTDGGKPLVSKKI
jgi:hypothetical protein